MVFTFSRPVFFQFRSSTNFSGGNKKMAIRLDPFAFRQFDDPSYVGTKIPFDKAEFTKRINEIYEAEGKKLLPGYAPFCKHMLIKNFVPGIKVGSIPITKENERLLKSDYVARRKEELPVLVRWFQKEDLSSIPEAIYLDIILYSKEQIDRENYALKGALSNLSESIGEHYEWGIISIKGQLEDHELPMTPITMLRNSLGKEYGGSGVPLDHQAYLLAVEFWKHNATIH
jgi:hypothetical protein